MYHRHADAYDVLITDPADPWVTTVSGAPAGRWVQECPGAGCRLRHGTARSRPDRAWADVTSLDASEALLRIARQRCPQAPALVSDLCAPALTGSFDAVISRGVLNDLLTDRERADAVRSFARLTRTGGLLALDVREAAMSRKRADGSVRRTDADLPDGSGAPTVSEHLFEMRPWTRDEIHELLTSVGYQGIEVDAGVGRRTADRLLVMARRQSA